MRPRSSGLVLGVGVSFSVSVAALVKFPADVRRNNFVAADAQFSVTKLRTDADELFFVTDRSAVWFLPSTACTPFAVYRDGQIRSLVFTVSGLYAVCR